MPDAPKTDIKGRVRPMMLVRVKDCNHGCAVRKWPANKLWQCLQGEGEKAGSSDQGQAGGEWGQAGGVGSGANLSGSSAQTLS